MEVLENTYNEPCIYCILNTDTGKMYFGLTKHYRIRVRDHVNDLKRNKHNNFYLQNSYNKIQKLTIFPVEKCELNLLKEKEIFWIKYHQSHIRSNGYNLTLGGEDLSHMTEEALIKKANSRRGKPGSLKGRCQSSEHIEARAVKNRGQKRNYTIEHIEAIKKTRAKAKGSRQKGKLVKVTNLETNEVLHFDSKRKVEDFFNIKRDSLIHKFYYGRPRQILKKIIFNNYLIQR
jgi:group I intron endonuclease